MHFFLQGAPQIGKSYLLQTILPQYNKTITGYTPQRLYNQQNEIVGYRAELMQNNAPVIALDGTYSPNVHNMFLNFQEKYKKITVLENLIHQVRINASSRGYDLIMLDEIGGFEMASEAFVADLFALLDANACVGVIKQQTRNMTHADASSNIQENCSTLFSKIQEHGYIYTLHKENRTEIASHFHAFLSDLK